MPVLVFEGLPRPTVDQTEAELVESVLTLVDIPVTSVRTAVRLPLRARGKSIVLVEMDTEKHQKEVIEHKTELRDQLQTVRSSLVTIGIRKAKYRELWRYVRQLLVAKEILENEKNEANNVEEENDQEEEEDPIFIDETSEEEQTQDEDNDEEQEDEDDDLGEVIEVDRKEDEPK